MMRMRILLPLDDSEFAEKNLAYIKPFAKSMGAELSLLRVVLIPTMTPDSMNYAPMVTEAEEVIKKQKSSLEADGFKVSAKVVTCYGKVGPVINSEAKKLGVDMIAIGARGKSVVRNLFLGTVADDVAHNASCPVLIIRQ